MTSNYINNKWMYSMLSNSNDFSDDVKYDIVKHGFLPGYKNIPNLYTFYATESGFENDKILTKDLTPFAFIEKSLKKQDSLNKNDIAENFEKFIEDNKPKLLKLMSLFSYAPKYIGGGIDGSAFDIGNNLVLKIFSESYSYYKAKEAYDRLHQNPELAKNEAMIYDIGIIGQFENMTLYYYIMEKMKSILNMNDNVQQYLTKIIGYIGQYIRHNKSNIDKYRKLTHDTKNSNDIKNFLNAESDRLEKLLYNEHSKQIYDIETYIDEDLNKNWVKLLCEEILFKYLTGRGDLHLGNLGLTNYGKFVYFDPSHSYWESHSDLVNTPSRDSIDFIDQENNESNMFV